MRWIFEQRLGGRSVARICRALNDRRIPCPSRADHDRNLYRSGTGWMLTTVAAILANPQYTGRQVWNRQHTDHDDLEPIDGIARQRDTERWSLATQWAISAEPAHPGLVSEADFITVQQIHTAPVPADGTTREYALTGLVFCGICGRALDAHWTHGRAGYRCRHGRSSAHSSSSQIPRILYCREDHLIELLRGTPAVVCAYPRLRGAGPTTVAAVVRGNGLLLVGDHEGWTVEADNLNIALSADPLAAVLRAMIPVRRDGDQMMR
jgi:hypothetical protein